MRDDRIGGSSNGPDNTFKSLGSEADWNATIVIHQRAVTQWRDALALFNTSVAPQLTDPILASAMRTTIQHGLLLHTFIEAGWRAMALVSTVLRVERKRSDKPVNGFILSFACLCLCGCEWVHVIPLANLCLFAA